jgi:hypothetical protein
MKTLTFKVTDDEARRIRFLSKRQNLSLSEYLRRRASGAGFGAAAPALIRCEFTGAMIFAPLPEQPPLTTETVRELLADFP